MDDSTIINIASSILAALGVFGGAMLYVGKLIKVFKESTDIGVALNNASVMLREALEDDALSESEIQKLKDQMKIVRKEIDEAKDAWLKLVKK